ncbi:DUF4912 domain-containing protein [Myxococcus sp. 1LA]
MEDLKSVTVSYLRELARKHLGSGYSRMKKEELLTALAAYVPALSKLARLAGIPVTRKRSATKPAAPPARSTASKKAKAARPEPAEELKATQSAAATKAEGVPGKGKVSAPKRVAAKRASEKPGGKPTTRPAKVVTFPPKPRVERAREPVTPVVSSLSKPVTPEPEVAPPPPVIRSTPVHKPAEPVVEGFFVARVAGEAEARSHHLVETVAATPPPPVDIEGLGALPEGYHDDSVLLLPRDPYTLFVSWDFSLGAQLRAQDGLDAPRPVLRVFDGEQMDRELAFAVEARGFYIHGLGAGRTYRVEAHFVGRDGRSRRIGASSNRVTLPPAGVSTDLTVRFIRVPPVEAELPPVASAEAPSDEVREYVSWRRVQLPGSGGVLDVPEVHRERAGKAEAHLEGPARAPGASDERYVEASERAPGASEQRYVDTVGRAAGASEQRYGAQRSAREAHGAGIPYVPRYLETLSRAPGASDLRYAEGGGATRPTGGAAPPYRYLDVKGIPGASDLRYAEGGAHRPEGLGSSPYRYLDVKGIPGASDLRYAEGAGSSAPSSQPRYLDVRSLPGASDLRYLETPDCAHGASEHRYLESPPPRPGASDLHSGDSRASASAQGASGAPTAPADVDVNHRYFEVPAKGRPSAPPTSAAEAHHRSVEAESGARGAPPAPEPEVTPEAEENHRYFELPRTPPAQRRPATQQPTFEAREDHSPQATGEPLPRKPPSSDDRS